MKHNLKVAGVVLLVRAPVMVALGLLERLGDWAGAMAHWLNHRLPAFQRERRWPR